MVSSLLIALLALQHPLQIEQVESTESAIRFRLCNRSAGQVAFSVSGRSFQIAGKTAQEFAVPAEGEAPFQDYSLKVESGSLPPLVQHVFVYRSKAHAQWITRPVGDYTIQIAPDGSGMRWVRGERTLALAVPLVQRAGTVPKLRLVEQGSSVRFDGDGVTVSITTPADEVVVAIKSKTRCEGPVLRALGLLEQGVFAGLEYLGKGESSSSSLDITTSEHWRVAPDPRKVTLPLMACRTDQATASMTWKDMALQPVFAAPNSLDGCPGHRMALRGQTMEATLRVQPAGLEEAIRWAVCKRGLPPLPRPPRERDEQWALCLQALNGPLKGEKGWGHCAEPNWKRQPYAEMASTIFRITSRVPDLPRLVPGGAHLRNDAIYLLTGRGEEWLDLRQQQAAEILHRQQPDGSFHYSGKYRRGHFEDTASGFCAKSAADLLEFAWQTGDRQALAGGFKALDYMKRFRTPRGAQTWELSLHTPDILATAHLVRAYVRGYELSGKREYLDLARKWAWSGLPFVYLWGDRPIMACGTVPVFGATNWTSPNWIGLPVQWCGLVYADALVLLAAHDQSFDWKHLARGILLAGEQMQFPDGPLAGCLPDSFILASQQRQGPSINPCALVSLRLSLDNESAGLAVANDGHHRVVAPFPVTLRDGKIQVQARQGLRYQLLIDGKQLLTIDSKGADSLPLTPEPSP